MSLYEVLGVDPGAPYAEILLAYRRRAKATHPDHGGDAEEFKRVVAAWAILGDEVKRFAYDASGEYVERDPIEDEARKEIAGLFDNYLNGPAPDTGNMRDVLEKNFERARKNGVQMKAADLAKIDRLKRTAARIKHQGKGDSLFHQVLDNKIQALEKQVAGYDRSFALLDAMGKILEEYAYYEAGRPSVMVPDHWDDAAKYLLHGGFKK